MEKCKARLKQFKSKTTSVQLKDFLKHQTLLEYLSPAEACYIGLEYANLLKTTSSTQQIPPPEIPLQGKEKFQLMYQERQGDLGYFDTETCTEHKISPLKLLASQQILSQFPPTHAFYIGLYAGFKIHPLNQLKSFILGWKKKFQEISD